MTELQHYFCLLTPARPDMHGNLSPSEQELFGAHCEYLRHHFDEKRVLQAGTSFEAGEEGFAIVILAAPDKTAATTLMANDPAVAAGLLTMRVTEYDTFLG